MKSLIFYCEFCGQYSLGATCPSCNRPTRNPIPPRFSPEDRYGKYRRILKKGAEQ